VVPIRGSDPGAHGEASAAVRGEAVIHLLRALGAELGVLIVLEDMHWADPDTVAVVDYLGANLATERVLCVLTSRDDPPSAGLDVIRRLRGRPGVTHLALARFDDAQVARMVRACVPGASDATVAEVQATADGVPLLVEELLASPGVPGSFADTVAARVSAFGPDERVVLDAAALVGRSFDWQLLPAATGLPRDVVVASLARAVDCLLVSVDDDRFRFRHALTREAVLQAMLPPRRAELAARCLAAIDALDPHLAGPWRETAADLALQAGQHERAGRLLVASGRAALRRGALATAVDALRRASALASSDGDTATEAAQGLLEALALAGRVDEAFATGATLIERLGDADPTVAARVHVRLAHAAVSATRWSAAAAQLDEAKALLGETDDPAIGFEIAVLDAEAAMAADRIERARELAAAVVGAPAAPPEARCQALEILGRAERMVDLDRARELFERALVIAEESDLAFWRLRALHELGTIELFDRWGTDRLYEARRRATELGAMSTLAVLDLQLSAALNALFSLDAGAEHARSSLELAERLGLDDVRAKALCFLAENEAHRGRRSEMERYVTLMVAATSDPNMEGFAWGSRGMLAFLSDDWPGAIDPLDRGTAILARSAHGEPAFFRCLWPLLLASTADRRAGAALEEARRLGIDRVLHNRGMLGYAEAILLGRRGETARATRLAAGADDDLRIASPWAHIPRLCAAGPAMTDGWGSPRSWLEGARDAFGAAGLASLVERCDRVLGAPSRVGARWGITARESDVLGLVADGLSNKEIAHQLHLSPRTVEKHVESLLRKTGSRSRTQLAVTAGQAG
jgi:DNA-binding CsgD family transcriptional regulator/tetratricopeptide (TPR) repeat protein